MITAISPEALAAAVRAERKAAGMSQVTLADKAGVNPETITRIELGKTTTNTTIGKLVAVMPGLEARLAVDPDSANQEGAGDRTVSDLADLAMRVGLLAQALTTRDRLHKARGFLIALLEEEQQELDSARTSERPDSRSILKPVRTRQSRRA